MVRQTMFDQFSATRTGLQDPNIRHTSHKKDRHGRRDQRRKRGGRNFLILDQGEYDGADGFWLQDEDTLEEGFLAAEDETVFWTIDDNEAFIARRFKKGRRPKLRPGSPGKAKGGKRKGRGRFRSYRGKGRANQAEHEPTDPSYYGKGKGKEKGGKGKGKGKDKGEKGSSFKGAKAKGKGKDAAKSASSQGDPSPQAYEGSAAPGWDAWYEDSYYTDSGWNYAAYDENTSYTYYARASKRKTRKHKRRTKTGSHGRGTDPSAHHEAVYNSSESYMPSTQNSGHGPGVDTASAVFPLQHTVLSALTERINLDKSPTYVILDSGCTRAMGSRYAVNRLIKAVERYAPGKIEFSFSPSNTKFSFADSETALIKERVTLSIEVLDQGKVPILFSIEQMRNLHMTLECSPTADLATCAAFGLYKTPLPVSTNNHLVLDLLGFTSTRKYPAKSGSSFQVSDSALGSGSAPEGRCPACEGKKRAHTYKKGCHRAVPDTSSGPPASTARTKGKTASSPNPKPAETSAGPSEPSSGSKGLLPEDSESPEPHAEDRLELPSGTVKTPASLKRLMKKTKEHRYVPKSPVDEKSMVPGADNGTKVRPLESKEYPAPKPESPTGEGIVEEEPVPEAAPSLPIALRRIHDKLKDPVELYKLHLKHRHMNLDQFKRRTTALQIPKETYELYDQLVKKCSTCQEHKRAPSRAKISGLRSDTFGDLTFVDHGELPIPGKNNRLVFLILYDGATNLLTSEVVQDKEEHTTMSVMNDYFEKYQINPKVVVGDQAFMTPQMEA